MSWDAEPDVAIVGLGGAGSAAAIEACDRGASVLVLERFAGGGATRMSGGIVYGGGGTRQQRAAGFSDDPEHMYDYLRCETEGAIDPQTLRSFCDTSAGDISWLESLGVEFPLQFYPKRTNEPPEEFGLYYSGNETQSADCAPPAPRGHCVAGLGLTGDVLFEALHAAALERGVDIHTQTKVTRLLTDETGRVIGVDAQRLDPDPDVIRRHHRLTTATLFATQARVPSASRLGGVLRRFEDRHANRLRVRANGGVVIAAGGFSFNKEMMRQNAPAYAEAMPLGTPGDDGSGIRLGEGAGAATQQMSRCAASRFVRPPDAFCMGILVNDGGERICDESLYAATLSRHISEQPGSRARLVFDAGVWRRARGMLREDERLRDRPVGDVLRGKLNHLVFRKLTGFANLYANRAKAPRIDVLADHAGIDRDGLRNSIDTYNRRVREGAPDEFGKSDDLRVPLDEPPFYAVRCDLDSTTFPAPCLTLGGLAVDGTTGAVLREDGSAIAGLYAAGRSAAGVSSRSYVSGLSIADCIHSGRRAGSHAAEMSSHDPPGVS